MYKSGHKDILGFIAIIAILFIVRKINNKLYTLAGLIVIGSIVYVITESSTQTLFTMSLFLLIEYLPKIISGSIEEGFEGDVADAVDDVKEDVEDVKEKVEEKEEDVLELIEKLEGELEEAKKHNNLSLEEEHKLLSSKDHDVSDDKEKIKNVEPSNKSPSEMTPALAQRETFRLIETVKMLEDTMKDLAPTLKEGHKVMESFKKIAFRDQK
jgi:hypothetical protein